MSIIDHDPSAVLDYAVDWSAWLDAAEDAISTSTWTIPAGLSQASPSPSHADGKATVWLGGGQVGRTYSVTNRIVTTGGRTDERSLTLRVADR